MTLSKAELELEERKEKAIDIALDYGICDGGHHKQWVIDQMIKALCTEEEYKEIVDNYPEWDHGIAP